MKSFYLILTIALLVMFLVPPADASSTYSTGWDGIEYDSIGGDYEDPDKTNGTPWICLSPNSTDTGVAVYKFAPTKPFPGLYKYTVSVYGYDSSPARVKTQFGLFDFTSMSEEIVYLGRGLTSRPEEVSGSVTSSLERFSSNKDEIWVVILSTPAQEGHIKSVELEIEYEYYPPVTPDAPWTRSGSPCFPQDFYAEWNSVPFATMYRLYEDGALLYEGPDTSTLPLRYSRPVGSYSFTVSAGNEDGWSTQGPEYVCVVRPSAGAVEHVYIPSGDQCDSQPFEISWSAATDATSYAVYISDINPPGFYDYEYETTIEVSLSPGKYYFRVKGAQGGCFGDFSPVDSFTVVSMPAGGVPVPVWTSSDRINICQGGGVSYFYWQAIPEATHYRVYENGEFFGLFGSQTTRIQHYHPLEGGEWKYWLQAKVGSCWGDISDTLTITRRYDPPPPEPAQPSTSPTTVCPNSTYTVYWSSEAGAVDYKLYENYIKVYEGSGLNFDCTNGNGPGSYEYYLKVSDGECWSNPGDKFNLEIAAPMATPDAIDVPDYVVPVDEQYVVAWSTVAGANNYRLYEDGGLILIAVDTQAALSQDTEGDYVYSVVACDECDCSDAITASPVEVREVTDVQEIPSEELPSEFTLSQNYPNPFNPVTNIDFALPRAAHVRMEVFNILGGKVCTLVDEYLSAGYKSVEWDGRSSSGRVVSSGIYLFRITAGEFSACRKALLMK